MMWMGETGNSESHSSIPLLLTLSTQYVPTALTRDTFHRPQNTSPTLCTAEWRTFLDLHAYLLINEFWNVTHVESRKTRFLNDAYRAMSRTRNYVTATLCICCRLIVEQCKHKAVMRTHIYIALISVTKIVGLIGSASWQLGLNHISASLSRSKS